MILVSCKGFYKQTKPRKITFKPNTMNYSLHREVNWVNCVICMNNLQHSETSMAGLMGRKREHWPEFQIRPHMSSREVLMVYMYSK